MFFCLEEYLQGKYDGVPFEEEEEIVIFAFCDRRELSR